MKKTSAILLSLTLLFCLLPVYAANNGIKDISVHITRPLDSVIDLEYGSNYNISHVTDMNNITLTYSNGKTEILSSTDICEKYDDFIEITTDQSSEKPWNIGKHKIQLHLLDHVYEQDIEVVKSPYKSIRITKEDAFALTFVGENGKFLRLPFSGFAYYDDTLTLYQNNMGVAYSFNYNNNKLTIGNIQSNSIRDCDWFQAAFHFDKRINDYIYEYDNFCEYFHPENISYFGSITADNIDLLIDQFILSGFYKTYTDKELDVEVEKRDLYASSANRSVINNTKQTEKQGTPEPAPTVPASIGREIITTLYCSESELRDIFSLILADVSSFSLSLSKNYDSKTGKYISSTKHFYGPVSDVTIWNSQHWEQTYDINVCVLDEDIRIGLDKDGKILFIYPSDSCEHTHSFGDWINHTETGLSERYCAICGLKETEPISQQNIPGDVSGDGAVTAEDARLALRAAVGLETYEKGSAEFLAADASKDGVITAEDARLILRAAVGLETLA